MFDKDAPPRSIIEGEGAEHFRARFVERFVNTQSRYFEDRIATQRRFFDGVYSTGYFWDTLRHSTVISESELIADLLHRSQVFVFSDILSAHQAPGMARSQLPRGAVLRAFSPDLIEAIRAAWAFSDEAIIPLDVYIVDASFTWALVATHESNEVGERSCLEASSE